MAHINATLDGKKYILDFHRGSRSVVEIAAHSLKLHHFRSGRLRTVKYSYRLGHDVYSNGKISTPTACRVVSVIRGSGTHPSLVIGTSAIRDAENKQCFVRLLEDELGLEVHVLSSWEETSLLAVGYLSQSSKLPALVVDVGGGSLGLVYLSKTRTILWDSLPLGAIRLYHREAGNGSSDQLELIDREFRRAAIVKVDEVFVTGGTARATTRILKKLAFNKRDLEGLEVRVREHGPPDRLKRD